MLLQGREGQKFRWQPKRPTESDVGVAQTNIAFANLVDIGRDLALDFLIQQQLAGRWGQLQPTFVKVAAGCR